jgi:TIR domain
MSHIFISYSKEDIDFVRYLRALLENEGFAVWMDETQLTPSARWWKDIEKNIDSCSAFVVVMSPEAYESDWVEREILRAENKKKLLYPVLLAGDPWSRLANIQFEDLRAGLRSRPSNHFLNSLRQIISPGKPRTVQFTIVEGDITEIDADVIALKYAQKLHGADKVVADWLMVAQAIAVDQAWPEAGNYVYLDTKGSVKAAHALFVGTPILRHTGYKQLREFASRVLSALAEAAPQTQHLAMTIHGPGFGLDEVESLLSQVGGYFDAIQSGQVPSALQRITIVEMSAKRVERLRASLENYFADGSKAAPIESGWGYELKITTASQAEVIPPKPAKPHAFVIMPPDKDLEDVFYFGIQGPIHALGLLCERIEGKITDEDLLNQAKARISTASAVIAVLTNADSIIYLQLGYAWGAGRPTIMLIRDGTSLPFETPAVLAYGSLKKLESALTGALDDLKAKGVL